MASVFSALAAHIWLQDQQNPVTKLVIHTEDIVRGNQNTFYYQQLSPLSTCLQFLLSQISPVTYEKKITVNRQLLLSLKCSNNSKKYDSHFIMHIIMHEMELTRHNMSVRKLTLDRK